MSCAGRACRGPLELLSRDGAFFGWPSGFLVGAELLALVPVSGVDVDCLLVGVDGVDEVVVAAESASFLR